MRTPLLLAVTVTIVAAGCGYRVDDCERPAEPFTIDEDLDEKAVNQLILANHVIDRSQLECEIVCESLYLDQHPKGGATGVGTCTLTIDGDLNGDPDAVVGSLQCSGQGIPQFCTDG